MTRLLASLGLLALASAFGSLCFSFGYLFGLRRGATDPRARELLAGLHRQYAAPPAHAYARRRV